MTAVLDTPADLTGLTDDELAAMYPGADDDTQAAILALCERRDRIADSRVKAQAKRRALYDEWREAAWSDYSAAEAATRGYLLSEQGKRETDEPFTLWSGSERRAMRLGSEEVRNWWLDHPRLTFTAYLRQRAQAARIQRDERERETMDTDQAPAALSHAERAARRNERIDDVRATAGLPAIDRMDAARQRATVRINAARQQIRAEHAAGTEVATREPETGALEGTVYAPGAMCLPPINGAEVLNQAYGYLGHMVYWPSEALQITATLYAAMAHGRAEKTKLPVFPYVPRLFLVSEEGGSGKSRAARIIGALCPDPKRLAEMTKASLIDLIAARKTVIITEFDTLVGATGRRTPWLAGLVNVGYEEDGTTSRKQGGVAVEIPLCGVLIGDGLKTVFESSGEVFKTMKSRCIIGEMFRAPAGYQAPKFRGEAKDVAADIQGRLARWMAQEVRDGIGDHEPILPEGLGNRPADLWEPLMAVAERAGGHWPALARFACERIETAAGLMGEEDAAAEGIDRKLAEWGAAGPSIPGVTGMMDGDEFE